MIIVKMKLVIKHKNSAFNTKIADYEGIITEKNYYDLKLNFLMKIIKGRAINKVKLIHSLQKKYVKLLIYRAS